MNIVMKLCSTKALVHDSVSASRLASARDPDQSRRPRGRRHGRTEVEPSQSQVQDEVQNPKLEGVRAWPQEPWCREGGAGKAAQIALGSNRATTPHHESKDLTQGEILA